MRRFSFFHIIFSLFLTTLCFPQEEIRGIWLDGQHICRKDIADSSVEKIAKAKLNCAFVLVWRDGVGSYFQTNLASLSKAVEKDFDPLAYFIQKCKEKGIAVHCWFINGSVVGNGNATAEHPEWKIKDFSGKEGKWFDFCKDEVRKYQCDLMIDLLKNYQISGLHFDYIRFPSKNYCYCEECRDFIKKLNNYDPLDLLSSLPTEIPLKSYPLTFPTSAVILAKFDDGLPAICLNKLGKGYVLLFNWDLAYKPYPLNGELIKRAVEWAKVVYLLRSPGYEKVANLLKNINISYQEIEKIEGLSYEGVLIVPHLYRLNESIAKNLREFVINGGRAIFIEGPAEDIGRKDVKEIIGMKGKGTPFEGIKGIVPVSHHYLLPTASRSLEETRERLLSWERFLKEGPTSLVRNVYKRAKEINKDVKVSAAVFYTREAAEGVLQDWYGWLREGIVDFVVPMAYVSDETLRKALKEWKDFDPSLEKIIPGLSIYKRENGKAVPKKAEDVIRQIQIVRENGAKGFVLFSLHYLSDEIISALANLPPIQYNSSPSEKTASESSLSSSKRSIIYVVNPISSQRILPFDKLIPGEISHKIEVIAAKGEYEPASFVISALSDLKNVRIEVSPLEGEKHLIPPSAIDIRVVKCWYRSGESAWGAVRRNRLIKDLIPGLLLHDDSLVKVDYQKGENYLKVKDKYIWISNPDEEGARSFKILPIEEYQVKDSDILLPFDVPAGTNKQIWLTIKVPNVKEGIYRGMIKIKDEKGEIANLFLLLNVLPFSLPEPRTHYDISKEFVSSIYYRGKLSRSYPRGSISSEFKSPEQLEKELRDMYEHGVRNPICYQNLEDKELFSQYMKIREKVGMKAKTLYLLNIDSAYPAALTPPSKIKETLDFLKKFGIEEVYLYGIDEARGERLTGQREAWQKAKECGAKIFVAGYRDSNFPLMGDIQDLLVCSGRPAKEEAEKWHSKGHSIWCYNYPQGGVVGNPEVYRRNFGLLLWRENYDGACTYAYQHSFGNIWNDFDNPYYRDHNFTYPTVNGVIDTIAWEGYREAIDDIKYAIALKKEIERAKNSSNPLKLKMAREADEFLEKVDVEKENLYEIRAKIVDYILGLRRLRDR